jgi:hypothetical protein
VIAYLDAGSGAAVVAALAAGGAGAKIALRSFAGRFSRKKQGTNASESDGPSGATGSDVAGATADSSLDG